MTRAARRMGTVLRLKNFHVDQEEPIPSPRHIASHLTVARHVDNNIRLASITFDITHGHFAGLVQGGSNNSNRGFNAMLSRLNASHVSQCNNHTNGAVTAHSQISHVIEKD